MNFFLECKILTVPEIYAIHEKHFRKSFIIKRLNKDKVIQISAIKKNMIPALASICERIKGENIDVSIIILIISTFFFRMKHHLIFHFLMHILDLHSATHLAIQFYWYNYHYFCYISKNIGQYDKKNDFSCDNSKHSWTEIFSMSRYISINMGENSKFIFRWKRNFNVYISIPNPIVMHTHWVLK